MLARESLFRIPGFGQLLRSWHAVPVDPKGGSAAGLKAILQQLLAGQAVHFLHGVAGVVVDSVRLERLAKVLEKRDSISLDNILAIESRREPSFCI